MSRVTLVLSGGGAKATAHLGAVRALRAAGIEPTRYVGTSMGAVMGAALAAGLTAEAVLARAVGIRRRDVARLSGPSLVQGLFAASLLQPEPLRRTIERFIPARTFRSLRHPLTVTAADLATGELVLFGDGGFDAPLATALAASTALPLWYPPVTWEGRRLVDGGFRGVLPLAAAARFPADLVVAVDAGPGLDSVPTEGRLAPPPLIRTHNEAVGVLMAMNTELEVANWRMTPGRPPLVYVRPTVKKGATFALSDMAGYEAAGYHAAVGALEALERERAGGGSE